MNTNFNFKTSKLNENNVKNYNHYRFLIVSLFFLLFSTITFAGDVALTWDASTSSSVGGYKLYYGNTSAAYTKSVDVGNVTSYQLAGLQDGAVYYFALKAYNQAKTVESVYSNEVSATIPTATPITVDFSANKTTGDTGMIVSFTPVTTGSVTGWSWDFGDGATSTAQNPTHTYNVAGAYSVSLTASGSSGSVTKTAVDFISVNTPVVPAPVANFTASSSTGIAPKSIAFTDTSTGNVGTWLWDFGDGSTSAVQNPSHTYTTPGVYTVSLTVGGAGGTNTMTNPSMITITQQTTAVKGLVAAYNFEGGTSTSLLDVSGLANNGVVNGPVYTADGRYGKAMLFDGLNDIVTVNDAPSLDLSTAFTLEAWVKPTAIQRSSILFKNQVNGSVYDLYAYEDLDVVVASFNDGVATELVKSKNPIQINQWIHLVSTYDGQYLRLYKNATNVAVLRIKKTVKLSNGTLQIGGNGLWGEHFKGYIDEIRIYNRALTKTEIQADMVKPI